MSVSSYDTIVVGLGAAGVTAASTLAKTGRKVLGLEAQERIGGRVNTVPFGNGVIELGAEWIHGTNPSKVYDLAVKNNVTVLPQDLAIEVFLSDGSIANQELMNELVDFCLGVVDDPIDKPEPLGEFITKKLMTYIEEKRPELLDQKDFLDEFLEFMNLLVDNYEASNDWNDVSALTRYQELEGHQHMSWHEHGYGTLFDILLNKFNNGPGYPNLELQLNKEVVNIQCPRRPKTPVVVKCKDATEYTAENVIVTVSIGVLKERHKALFTPALPATKLDAIDKISFGVVDKVVLCFDKAWWPGNVSFFGFLWRKVDKMGVSADDYWTTRIFGASQPMGSGKCLTLWTSGDVAKLVENLPEDVVKRKCMELLRKFMGSGVIVPEPIGFLRSNWYSNPHTRGSYTNDNALSAADPSLRGALEEPLQDEAGVPRVLFAGEATSPVHFSTVHGAVETGYKAARMLLPASKI